MKITQLMLSKGFGGAERYFVDLSRALAKSGHDIQVICHKRFKHLDELRMIKELEVETVAPWGWWDFMAQRQIHSAIARYQPQIVHAHLARGAHLAGRPCAQLKIPLVVKTHNYVDLKYYRHVNCFIATTEDQYSYLQAQGIARESIHVIPNFSSMPPAAAVKGKQSEVLQLVSYGRLVKKKGFHILLEAVRNLIDAGMRVRLRVGGDGPEHQTLTNLRAELGLDAQVELSGWVENVADFASGADVFVLPSLDEAFGIAVLEMMASGIPIVATRTQGPLEILDDHTAWMADPGSSTALAAALTRACEDKQARQRKAESALVLFNEKYAESIVVPKIVALYQYLSANVSN